MTLEQAKRQCRVDDDLTIDDDDILDWITAARELGEAYTKRTFCPTTWQLLGSDFPREMGIRSGCLILPMGPVISVETVSYTDTDGSPQTIDPSAYQLVQEDGYGELWANWPQTLRTAGAVVVQYRAGYPGQGSPEDASGVPAAVRSALRTLIGHWYANRESVVAESRLTPASMPFTFERALDHLKVYP